MKKALALILALMLLMLAACGQGAEPADQAKNETGAPAESESQPTASSGDFFVKTYTAEDGSKVTEYYDGGADGPMVRIDCEMPDGAYSEVFFDTEGKLISTMAKEPDGTVHEMYFYPSGNISKTISRGSDGIYQETHYLDNGVVNEQTGEMFPGSICYEKFISADGEVQESTFGEDGLQEPETVYEEDGSKRVTTVLPDGTIIEEHISADFYIISQSVISPDGTKIYSEFYKDETEKCRIEETGSYRIEQHFDEEGYHTYYHQSGSVGNMEIIADETGKVVKVLVEGQEMPNIEYWVTGFNFRSW